MFGKESFPKWFGPFMGVSIGAGFGYKAATEAHSGLTITQGMILGAVLGGTAGIIVLLMDLKRGD
jgi:hypothetical protein